MAQGLIGQKNECALAYFFGLYLSPLYAIVCCVARPSPPPHAWLDTFC